MPLPPSPYWIHWSHNDFLNLQKDEELSQWTAVLPLAAIEQHGPHLPVGVDTLLLEGLLKVTLEQLPATSRFLILPTQTIGRSIEHSSFVGTLSLSFFS